MLYEEYRQSITVDGVKLEIIASYQGENEWELSIENSRRIRTVWDELFASANAAIDEGLRAIEAEGLASFAGDAGFEFPREL